MGDYREPRKYCWLCRNYDEEKSKALKNEEMIHCNVYKKPVSCQVCNSIYCTNFVYGNRY